MDNEKQLVDISLQLYQYLSDVVVGSEHVIKYRQFNYKVLDEINTNRACDWISSGSKAEGLNLPGSDIDWMFLMKCVKVYDENEKGNDILIIMDVDNANEGFALLKATKRSVPGVLPIQMYATSFVKYFYIVPNNEFKESFPNPLNSMYTHIQGPSLAHSFIDEDNVICIQCNKWPSKAGKWLSRNTYYGWPTASLKEDIIHSGVLLVPVGSKFNTVKGDSREWRFSFSLAEKALVHSFNHTQILCYSLLKIFLKEIINKDETVTKLLCSYYTKTLLFWVMEEVDQSRWNPKHLLNCFSLCTKRLHYWILCNYLPNYFIPEHNLIDGKISNESRSRFCELFEKLLSQNGLKFLLSALSLQDFHLYSSKSKTVRKNEMCKALYPIIYKLTPIYKPLNISQNQNISKLARTLCALSFIEGFIRQDISVKDQVFITNKQRYYIYNKVLASLLMLNYRDASTGWFLMAEFYYCNRQYEKLSSVLRVAAIKASLDLLLLDDEKPISFMKISLETSKSFMKRIRHEVIRPRAKWIELPMQILKFNLCQDSTCPLHALPRVLACHPSIYLQFLTFLYNLKTQNPMRIKISLDRLKVTIEKTVHDDLRTDIVACNILEIAYKLYPLPLGLKTSESVKQKIIRRRNVKERLDFLNTTISERKYLKIGNIELLEWLLRDSLQMYRQGSDEDFTDSIKNFLRLQ